jgi:cation diffusion facilitator family transporter
MHHHHHHHFTPNNKERGFLVQAATYASVGCALLIVAIKIIGWLKTDSISMLASLSDSLLDVGSSLINMLAVKYALQPPDDEHRFGHNKAEDLAVFTQSAFFAVSGAFLLINCIKRFFDPQNVENSDIGIIVMILSIVISIILIIFQRYVIKKTNSHVIEADHLHYTVDLLSNIGVIIAIILGNYFHTNLIDPLFGFLISIYIFIGAWKLLKKAFKNLMDHEFEEQEKNKITEVINKHPEVYSIHHLKTRYAGSKPFIQFHLVMDGNMILDKAHKIAHEIEDSLLEIFPDADIIIHQDPKHDH